MNFLTTVLFVNIASFVYCDGFYPPNFFLKGPTAKATIYGVDGSKISSVADAGSISNNGIEGASANSYVVAKNGTHGSGGSSSQHPEIGCANCNSESASLVSDGTKYNPSVAEKRPETNSGSYPGGSNFVLEGPSMTSTIIGPKTNNEVVGSGSANRGYYAPPSYSFGHHETGVVDQKSTDCDDEDNKKESSSDGGSASSSQSFDYQSDGTPQGNNQHSGVSGVHIQGPSVSSSISGAHSNDNQNSHGSNNGVPSSNGFYQSSSLIPTTYPGGSNFHIKGPSASSSITGPQTNGYSHSFDHHSGETSQESGQHLGSSGVHIEGPSVSSSISGPESNGNQHSHSNANGLSGSNGFYTSPSLTSTTYQHPGGSNGHIQGPSASSSITGPQSNAGTSQGSSQHFGTSGVYIKGSSASSSIGGPRSNGNHNSKDGLSTSNGFYSSSSLTSTTYHHPAGSDVHIQGPSVSSSVTGASGNYNSKGYLPPHNEIPTAASPTHTEGAIQYSGESQVHIQGPFASSSNTGSQTNNGNHNLKGHLSSGTTSATYGQSYNQQSDEDRSVPSPNTNSQVSGNVGSHTSQSHSFTLGGSSNSPSANPSIYEQPHNQYFGESKVHMPGPFASSPSIESQSNTDIGSHTSKNNLPLGFESSHLPSLTSATYKQQHTQYLGGTNGHRNSDDQNSNVDVSSNGATYESSSFPPATYMKPNVASTNGHYPGLSSPINPQQVSNGASSNLYNQASSSIGIPAQSSDYNRGGKTLSHISYIPSGGNGYSSSSSYTSYSAKSKGSTASAVPNGGYSGNAETDKDYYESSSFAPATYTVPENTHNLAANVVSDGALGVVGGGKGTYNKDYDCYVIKLPISTYAYVVPSKYSLFLKKLAESGQAQPVVYPHQHHHHNHY